MKKQDLKFFVVEAARASQDELWAGEAQGRKAFPRLLDLMQDFQGTLCVVDLTGIKMVTASAFRSSMRALRDHVSGVFHAPTVFANASDLTVEEATYVASKFSEAYLFAEWSANQLHSLRLVGNLDDPLRTTLSLLQSEGPSDAKSLHAIAGAPGVTAWHNRLSELEDRGLVVAVSEGRSRVFQSIL
ncbi:MAG: hypothetical protein KF686_17130 [Ramlibacter sp.]|nr:hypothetical protein [Ramlibacter sp.]